MKPDSYLLDIDHVKGFSLTDFSTWGLSELSNPEGKKLSTLQAWTDVGWTRRCVGVRAKSLASLPFGVYRGDTLVWNEQMPKPEAFGFVKMWDFLYRTEVALALVGAAYALKEGTVTQEGAIRRLMNLRWYDPMTMEPDYQGPRNEAGEFQRFVRRVNGRTEYWDRRVVWHCFLPDPFTEQGPPKSTDAGAIRVNAQILADMAQYTSDQLRSGLVKKTVAVAKEGRPPGPDEAKRVESWLGRWLYGRGKPEPKILSGNIDFKTIGASLDELAQNAISEEQQRHIATGLGVPHSLVMSDAANYATAQADQVNFLTTTLGFQARVIQDCLNAQIFEDLGFEFRFEIDRHEAMQASELEKANAIAPLVMAGVYPVAYAQEVLNVPDEFRDAPQPVTDEAVMAEVRNWRKKVERRGPDVKFSPDVLGRDEAEVIRERLAAGMDLDSVFQPPFV